MKMAVVLLAVLITRTPRSVGVVVFKSWPRRPTTSGEVDCFVQVVFVFIKVQPRKACTSPKGKNPGPQEGKKGRVAVHRSRDSVSE